MLRSLAALVSLSAASLIRAQDAYVPIIGACPTDSLLRENGGQNPQEVAYVTTHKAQTASIWQEYLTAHNPGYDLSVLAPNASAWPTFGIACSGGGYRAALGCAGAMSAFDLRNTSTTVGGIVQMASFLSGLSGGSWSVGSWASQNFPDWTQLVLGNATAHLNGWQLQYNLVAPGGANVIEDGEFLDHIDSQIKDKQAAGFNISITDAWGRALSYHFANGTTDSNFYTSDNMMINHGANITWSSLTTGSAWTSGAAPIPVLVTNGLPNNLTMGNATLSETYLPATAIVYEFTPWEFGSHDSALAAFVNVTYLGTNLISGQPSNTSACVTGFENLGFVMGTSASLFNSIFSQVNTSISQADYDLLEEVFEKIGDDLRDTADDVAIYPNPFQGVAASTFDRSNNSTIELVDGGENLENIPLRPLLVPARGIDAIIANDNSADTDYSWPNGTSLIAVAQAGQQLGWNVTLPPIPDNQAIIVNSGFNTRPVFFGCNASTQDNVSWPILIYLPNAPNNSTSYLTNTSTFQLEYDIGDASLFLDTAHANAAQLETERQSDWPTCLACALVERARARMNVSISTTCQNCFANYCYGGANLATNTSTSTDTTGTGNVGGAGRSVASRPRHRSVLGAISGVLGAILVA